GDTRFDTVIEIAENFKPIPAIEAFLNGKKCIVVGSSWGSDEEVLQKVLTTLADNDIKLIIAPHEVNEGHLKELEKLFPVSARFSELPAKEANILIIDNVGMLSRLYKYSYIAYIGGGFTGDGVHNILEAAVYGKPVVFGKNFKKYKEAIDLIDEGGANSFLTENELTQILLELITNQNSYRQRCEASKRYVLKNKGATEKILAYIDENRLLTR
ncbi:MAG TPA: 3-deoxy-D-manno-octulosonic acid transferase, partial [Chitinophagaceae bacterium]